MNTNHKMYTGDSSNMAELADNSVHLVVTSPPYPMIEMWDEMFSKANTMVGRALEKNMPKQAFEEMHKVLDKTWAEVDRVMIEGGMVCINIGDATRSFDKSFQCYPNAARITQWFFENGYNVLPRIHWRKPTNKANKFMGSGMLPPNAYVTLEEESVLVFRKGLWPREFTKGSEIEMRRASAYFYEERNKWFSDSWDDIPGSRQEGLRGSKTHHAVYPVEIPLRLIHMYSIYGDTVLDPFAGTGTTLVAAMASGRSSVGYDTNPVMVMQYDQHIKKLDTYHDQFNRTRIRNHKRLVESGKEFRHESEVYDFPVTNGAEKTLRLFSIESYEGEKGEYTVRLGPYKHLPEK